MHKYVCKTANKKSKNIWESFGRGKGRENDIISKNKIKNKSKNCKMKKVSPREELWHIEPLKGYICHPLF